jgi:predicted  nucleic acid-binding Zn-ribbon protein
MNFPIDKREKLNNLKNDLLEVKININRLNNELRDIDNTHTDYLELQNHLSALTSKMIKLNKEYEKEKVKYYSDL